jgi:hypothetical protein
MKNELVVPVVFRFSDFVRKLIQIFRFLCFLDVLYCLPSVVLVTNNVLAKTSCNMYSNGNLTSDSIGHDVCFVILVLWQREYPYDTPFEQYQYSYKYCTLLVTCTATNVIVKYQSSYWYTTVASCTVLPSSWREYSSTTQNTYTLLGRPVLVYGNIMYSTVDPTSSINSTALVQVVQ